LGDKRDILALLSIMAGLRQREPSPFVALRQCDKRGRFSLSHFQDLRGIVMVKRKCNCRGDVLQMYCNRRLGKLGPVLLECVIAGYLHFHCFSFLFLLYLLAQAREMVRGREC
jgi:hypothetical protein